jgi:tetratricopeptide (TPR) repeat protein
LIGASALAVALLGCGTAQTTQRVIHGRLVVGPYVEPEAYAAFAEGVYLEARGDWSGATRAFRRARALDPDSPAIATRLGAVSCRTSLEQALEELETSGLARDYAPAWAERARCLHRHGDRSAAFDAARRAVMLDPANPDANLLTAELQREAGQAERARTWLFAWALYDPAAAAHSEAIRREGQLLGDDALVALAATLAHRAHAGVADGTSADADASPARRALLQIARGQPELAAASAQLGIDANPDDPDALVTGLVASHLLADEAAFLALLRRARSSGAPAADTAALMAELLRARVGDEAAEQWLAAHRRVTAPP